MASGSGDAVERRLVVDRLEGDLAVVEVDGAAVVDLPRWLLPAEAREGDVVRVRVSTEPGARSVRLEVDPEATSAARAEAEAVLQRLRARDPGGDLRL